MGSLLLVAVALGVAFALGFFMGQAAGLRRGLREAARLVPPGAAGSAQPPAAPVVWRPEQADRASPPCCA